MCSIYIIDGKRCETGRDLASAIGAATASLVNVNVLPAEISEEKWLASCLCHVDRAKLREITGVWYESNSDGDFEVYRSDDTDPGLGLY